MYACIPHDSSTFEDQTHGSFDLSEKDIESSNKISTEYGKIRVVEASLALSSKLRRYKMQKDNIFNFKTGDLLDMANMATRHYDEGLWNPEKLEDYLNRFLKNDPSRRQLMDDTIESLESNTLEEEFDSYDVESALRVIKEI